MKNTQKFLQNPLAVFLMCWFHVEFKVGKHKISKGVPKELIPMVKKYQNAS